MTTSRDSNAEDQATKPEPRRAYTTPKLRRLGSVRELTLGGTMGATESVGFNNKGKGM
jgi:hypothetical protein